MSWIGERRDVQMIPMSDTPCPHEQVEKEAQVLLRIRRMQQTYHETACYTGVHSHSPSVGTSIASNDINDVSSDLAWASFGSTRYNLPVETEYVTAPTTACVLHAQQTAKRELLDLQAGYKAMCSTGELGYSHVPAFPQACVNPHSRAERLNRGERA